ncbi:MAG: PhoH family protein [Bdellovibrionales bacterium]|nr:PhoH family protein [Bdellovibrionales bacterium]
MSTTEAKLKVVLDTNVILFDAQAIFKFDGADIYIPVSVIEEIDRFKRDTGENGRNARQFSRFIDELRGQGKLLEGVKPANAKSKMFVMTDRDTSVLPVDFDLQKADNRILASALSLKKQFPDCQVDLISKDINLRIKADIYNVVARDYEPDNVNIDEMYDGYRELELTPAEIDKFYTERFFQVDESFRLVPNEYIVMRNKSNPSHSALGRFSQNEGGMVPLKIHDNIWGIHPRNMEQSFAFDALLNPDIQLVSLVGKAGTGKTLLALAAGLLLTLDESKFQRLLVSRPIFPMGKDIGYLPGDINEKLNPWMQPIFDNVDFLMGADTSHKKAAGRTQELMNQGLLNIEPLTYIRGRSIPHQYLIVDESQNLTPHELKTIITRAGQGTKVILTGDCYQIDNPYLDSSTSGLTYCVERFKGVSIAAHVTLRKGERSQLAELASNVL